MKRYIRKIGIQVLAIIMIGLWGLLSFNQTVNIHFHRLPNGTLVSHAHPYNKTNDSQPIKTHHHSKFELFFLKNVEITGFLSDDSICFLTVGYSEKMIVFQENHFQLFSSHYTSDRAPPFVL
jgi:hypothetical protein